MSSMTSPAPAGFQVRAHVPVPTVVVLRPEGALDMLTSPELTVRIEFHLGCGRHAVVDLREIGFLGSSALHAFMAVHATARAAGLQLHLTGGDNPVVAQVLAMTGLATVLPVSTLSTEAVVASLAYPRRPRSS